MTDTAGTGTDTVTATDGDGTTADPAAGGTPDYEALYKASQLDVDKWKTQSRKHEKLQKENAAAAATVPAQQDMLAKVAAALGLDTGDKAPDAAAITAQLEAAKASAASQAREVAVLRAAGRLAADGDALLDSRAFLAQIADLDPADTAAITEAINQAVKANPRYAAGAAQTVVTPTRQASGTTDFNGSPGGQRQWTEADVARATPAQLATATKAGLLAQYLTS